MSSEISQIKAEIKEWQRAHRRIHGRDPGKEELRNNLEMQAKYKIWQASLKADKDKDNASTAATPPKHASKSILPKKMPVQSSAGPTTPFSARKKVPRRSLNSSSSPSQPSKSNPFSQSPATGPRTIPALDLSASKPRAFSSKSTTRIVPFDSASSARHRPFPVLDSDSDEDDNPFAPTSPSRSRRPSQLISPSRSARRRQSTNQYLSPTRPKRPLIATPNLSAMTPRTKARKRMRGEEVPTTPGDKRRKLLSAPTQSDKNKGPTSLFGEPRGTKRPSSDYDDGDDEVLDSPRKRSAVVGVNGRIFTSMFDDAGEDEVASPRTVTFASPNTRSEANELDTGDGEGSLRSTPPPPPSESGDSHFPDEDEEIGSEDNDNEVPPVSTAVPASRSKLPNPVLPSRWTQDTWDAPVPGADLSHLRKDQFNKNHSTGKSKPKPKAKSDANGEKKDKDRLANPFELLPPIPGEDAPSKVNRYGEGRNKYKGKGKDAETIAELKKRAKEAEDDERDDAGESSDVDEKFVELVWRPHGPLHSAPSSLPPSQSANAPVASEEHEEPNDPAHDLPSHLRTLLSLHSTRRDETKAETLARDVLAGRARAGEVEVWGVGDLGDWEEDGVGQGEEGDWESEPEGWTGGVEM